MDSLSKFHPRHGNEGRDECLGILAISPQNIVVLLPGDWRKYANSIVRIIRVPTVLLNQVHQLHDLFLWRRQ